MKAYRFLFILLVIIIVLPVTGRLLWMVKKDKPIDILIINKTVQKSTKNEVKTLCWALNFEKFVDTQNNLYNYHYDYLGFFPDAITEDRKIKTFKLEDVSSLSDSKDVLYYVDNAGVDYKLSKKKDAKSIIYGGFNQNDYFLLKEMLGKKKLVVTEYNFFSPPTDDLVRYNTEKLLDVYSQGWKGKFFADLSRKNVAEEVPSIWFDRYQQGSSSDWDFSGPGILLLNYVQNRVLVLPAAKYMSSKYPEVVTNEEFAKEYNLPAEAAFSNWFDISYEGKNTVVSDFNLNLNKEGQDLLHNNGIDGVFPAVIASPDKRFYYLAGDFSKSPVFMPMSRLGYLSTIYLALNKGKVSNPDKFFPVYYEKLISSILNSYYQEKEKNPEQ
ncbi:MAG: hypothetical protein H6538_04760 [Bacteroidales bacterium]|nr:hypothetical protein [Bacteroidales bacterium]MCB8998973.1 hypothetical protein [Bacteroidales bacterium]MCB9013740.1 hypothetical protein [Bacteroidales bacterium]